MEIAERILFHIHPDSNSHQNEKPVAINHWKIAKSGYVITQPSTFYLAENTKGFLTFLGTLQT